LKILVDFGWSNYSLNDEKIDVVVIVSADIEWRAIQNLLPELDRGGSPYGEFCLLTSINRNGERRVLVFQGGWGKISAAASAQYAIDQWKPRLLVNIGTCGGFEGEITRGALVLVERTIVYDIFEQMGDPEDHITYYTTELDLSWLHEPFPEPIIRGTMVSGDRDLFPEDIRRLKLSYGAVAGDWESGSIAFVANRNNLPCLILRGVSDLVGELGGEAYGNLRLYENSAQEIMTHLVETLPDWLERADVFRN
jgi:adenosylhomocysteine nucleosidase